MLYKAKASKLPFAKVIDMTSDMIQYTVLKDGDTNLRFRGERLAFITTNTNKGPSNIHWTEITIYRTEEGQLIASVEGRSQWQSEHDIHNARVCDGPEAVRDYLIEQNDGHLSWPAKEALREAGFERVTYEVIG